MLLPIMVERNGGSVSLVGTAKHTNTNKFSKVKLHAMLVTISNVTTVLNLAQLSPKLQ
jgi:hypothetical protein